MNVADVIARDLPRWGARDIFGVAGSGYLPLLHAIALQPELRYHGVRHEESAALMASAQAKLTGRIGVCVANTGPGAAHLVNGLYDAHKDRVPVLALTAQVPTARLGTNYHQYAAQNLLFQDCAGFSEQVASPASALHLLEAALRYAMGASDVAHLAVPADLFAGDYTAAMPEPAAPLAKSHPALDAAAAERAVQLLEAARRPLILMGRGALRCAPKVLHLAEHCGAPIISSLFAKGALPERHPLVLGPIGEAGTDAAVQAARDADLLLVLGSTWWPDYHLPSDRSVIQVDTRLEAIGAGHPLSLGVLGRVEDFVDLALQTARQGNRRPEEPHGKQPDELTLGDHGVHPAAVMETLRRHVPQGAIVTVDTGLTTLWYGRSFEAREERTLLSGSWRTMGFALPAAIGAQLAAPKARVVALAGDGGFLMSAHELVTAVRERLPIVALVLTNGTLGEEQARQNRRGLPEFGMTLENPDFASLAIACGAAGLRADSTEALDAAFGEAFSAQRPVVVDISTLPVAPPTLQTAPGLVASQR